MNGRAIDRTIERVLQAAAALLTLAMLVTALHDVSQAWDSGYYHLPFAARIVGILPPTSFVFHPANAARFEGFPLLGERLQGLLWRLTGRAEATNLVSFASVPLLAWLLRARFGVPWHLTVLALFAVPLVQMHATSAYVDLPANAALSGAVLLAIEAYSSPERPRARTLVIAFACAAVAANMKALLHPITAVALVAITARALPSLARARDLKGPTPARALVTLGAIALALPIVFATPLANLIAHGNPYYPVRMSLLGHALPGTEAPYASSPPWLENAPRPFRFVCSLLEIGIRSYGDERRWSVDQWMPDETGGNRMGGFFGVYVVANVALLAWRGLRDRSRAARAAVIGFAVLTAVVSVMPQSHELRYYLCWMIVLVSLNLWLATRDASSEGAREGTERLRSSLGLLALLTLGIVIAVTRADYVLPSGSSFATLVRAKVDPRVFATIREGERVCVQREPWNLLWASTFHRDMGRSYVVVEAEEPGECAGARLLE